VATLLGWPGGSLFVLPSVLYPAGAVAALLGTAGALFAQAGMGESWRVGVDESEAPPLVTHGLFAWVRNPIFSFMGVSALGLSLLVPSAWTLVAIALSTLGIELQVRFVEEPHLQHIHGNEYARYAARTGRFVPGVGRMRSTGSARATTGPNRAG
jgi:protein-S-isoprenylcysteine O-methyltransferase Ste14